MIRKSGIALALIIMAIAAKAAELSLEQGTLTVDKTASLKMTFTGGKDAATGVQFDLEYDAAALDITVEGGPVAQQAGKNVRSAQIRPGKLRVLIFGFNRNTLSDGVVALVHASFKGGDGAKMIPVHITAAAGTTADAEPIPVAAKDGSVRLEK
jgi:Cohesin domain